MILRLNGQLITNLFISRFVYLPYENPLSKNCK